MFLHGHGVWTSVENVIVGPFIAIISFVCSIGNVPLAAALWQGGISFGGVVAFIFADLITFPLLLIYRRYYGTRLTLRMLAVFWAVMSAAGLITEGIFRAAGARPDAPAGHDCPRGFSWNYTTYLNIVFLVVFGVLYWLYRNRERLGSSGRYARDPVCGMQVEMAHAPASPAYDGQRMYFCSDRCASASPPSGRSGRRTEREEMRQGAAANDGTAGRHVGNGADHAGGGRTQIRALRSANSVIRLVTIGLARGRLRVSADHRSGRDRGLALRPSAKPRVLLACRWIRRWSVPIWKAHRLIVGSVEGVS